MRDAAKKRRSANPHDVLRNLAGLKSDSSLGFLPVILSNTKAERALHDLRAIALRFLDVEFLTAIRPSHSEPAQMLDAGIDVIGYAAFVQSKYRDYAGIHENLAALHDYLLNTREADIVNYDLRAFLTTLRVAREAVPALAAATAALGPLLTEERIFRIAGGPRENAKLIRRIYSERHQFAEFFGALSGLNEVVARFFPLLMEEPDVSKKKKNKRTRLRPERLAPDPKRKPGRKPRPTLKYYRPASAAIKDQI